MIIKQISASDLHALLEQDMTDSAIVDVRTNEEFKKGAIVGAINVPVDKLSLHLDRLRDYKKIYLYCLSGGRSEFAATQLSTLGLTAEIYNLTSGLLAWRKQGYPLV